MRISRNQNTRSLLALVHLSFMLCGVLLAGCKGSKTAHSGFLGDYSQLRDSSEFKGAMEYENPNLTLADYDKFMIDPILVHFAPNAKGTALDPAKVAQLTTGEIDRIDDFVSGTVGEIQFSVSASSGSPGRTEFTASSDEDVLLRLRAASDTLLAGILGLPPGFESFPVRYAVTVREIEPSGGPFPRP